MAPQAEAWIASRSLSSGARSRDPLARNDEHRLFNEDDFFTGID
ncbi:hypothetical protein [Bradyrhizobium ivorense]|nr:hypothetical protein [Bradyrhizobium ivorense]